MMMMTTMIKNKIKNEKKILSEKIAVRVVSRLFQWHNCVNILFQTRGLFFLGWLVIRREWKVKFLHACWHFIRDTIHMRKFKFQMTVAAFYKNNFLFSATFVAAALNVEARAL
jgi:hypothetical protein